MKLLLLFIPALLLAQAPLPSPTNGGAGGSGSGTVTDITISGTTGQIVATGASCTNGTTIITCTLSIPSAFVLPGTINGLTLTSSTGTFTLTNAKTFSVLKTLTLDGTDGVTITFPSSSATVATLGLTNTFTGRQDASGAASTAPSKVGTSPPGTCTVGDQFFDSDATAGSNLYGCTATNTWTLQAGGGGGSGTVTVVGAGSLTSTALVTGGGSQTIQTPAATATMDSSGNISTPGTISTGGAADGCASGTASCIGFGQGTAPSGSMTTGIQEYAPTSVTSYNRVKPGTVGASGVVKVTVASTTATESFGLASLTADVTGTLPVANGGTGITSFGTGVATALGANVSGSGAICLASGSACGGGGSDPFDLSSITQTDTFAGNPTSIVANGGVGDLRWLSLLDGTGALTKASNEAKWNGGVVLVTGSTMAGAATMALRDNGGEAAGWGWTNLTTLSAWHMQILFKTPDANATGAFYRMWLDSGGFSDFFGIQYIQGTDTVWVAKLRAGGGSTSTACTASAAPAASTYYILDISTSGSSTATLHLYANGTAFTASGDLFTACTATLSTPASGLAPYMTVQNQTANTNFRLVVDKFVAKFTF